jgi:hypothetical protein
MLLFFSGPGIEMNDLHQTLIASICDRRRLRFVYNAKIRRVEPQCYGIGTRGTELLRVYQLEGGEQREPLFDVAKITDLSILEETFSKPGPNYKKDDLAMVTIFCQL